MEFNHADLFEGLADAIGDRPALVAPGPWGVARLTYAELDAHASRLAHHLRDAGVGRGDHVGVHLYNGLEYIASVLAALKLRAVPVNVNYRYVSAELEYLYRDAALVALVYDASFEDRVNAAALRAPTLRHRVVCGGSSPNAVPYVSAVEAASPGRGFGGRSADDLYIIYTGGTTGMPKGVMWRCEDLFMAFGGGNPFGPPRATPDEVIEAARAGGGLVMMTAAPLMHGAAQMTTFLTWWQGGTVVYNRRFDAREVLRTAERERVVSLGITGDAMARPLVEEIAAGSYDLSSLAAVSSTGAILSGSVRDRLGALLPDVAVIDSFGSSESGYTAAGVEGSSPETGLRYRPNTPHLKVLGDDLRPVPPGGTGQVAKSGHIALGYWNDEAKTARTFVEVDGVRWLLTGDIATVEEDGTIAVLGRGSQCVNTGGEKVFPEEVEAVLKAHPSVFDAVVTGVPDERFGERVAAVIQPYEGPVSREELDAHCRERLSGYKVPRTYAFVAKVERSPAGKADYRWARRIAENA
jgi:acyl-CoA synthetase (AMP-forming)/AMP-acid ligase II